MKTSEILKRAIARIRRGWCKGATIKHIRGKWHYCSIGAITVDTPWMEYTKAKEILQDIIGPGQVSNWNDHHKTTKRKVLAAFEKAYRLAKERGL